MTNEEQPKKSPRPSTEIQAEYANLCATAGQNAYQAALLEQATKAIYRRFDELNSEMKAAKEAESAAPQPE